jgi:hypothetical protein
MLRSIKMNYWLLFLPILEGRTDKSKALSKAIHNSVTY